MNPFAKTSAEQLHRLALDHGFRRLRERNWVKRTVDFVQIVNLQRSQWSDDYYLNFGLWPLSLGSPPRMVESQFKFRARGEVLGAYDLESFFAAADKLSALSALREALQSRQIAGAAVTKDMQHLLD